MANRFAVYASFVDHLQKEDSLHNSMFDLCSGSGEPAVEIFNRVSQFESLQLSDKFPSTNTNFNAPIVYIKESVDALKTSFDSSHTYTMFNAFHHFKAFEQQELISKIRVQNAQAYIVEILTPGIFVYIKIFFTCTLGTLLFTPFIKPFSWRRLLFTYPIPINLFSITFDGLVSVCKSKSLKQYQTLFANTIHPPEIVQLKKGLFSLIVIKIKHS